MVTPIPQLNPEDEQRARTLDVDARMNILNTLEHVRREESDANYAGGVHWLLMAAINNAGFKARSTFTAREIAEWIELNLP
jgi:hypothetical protein